MATFGAPILDIKAVTQEPIFCPNVIYIAADFVTIPFIARVCKIPTEADELCKSAVTTHPTIAPRNGLPPITANASANIGKFVYGFIPADIVFNPRKSSPRPKIISPIIFFLSKREKHRTKAPKPTSKGA